MVGGGGGGYSQRLLSLNPTIVQVVLLLGLWLLLGCDNYDIQALAGESDTKIFHLLSQPNNNHNPNN